MCMLELLDMSELLRTRLLIPASAAFVLGCGPQVSQNDADDASTDEGSASDASLTTAADGDATSSPATTSSADSAGTAIDESGDPPPLQTWCIEEHAFTGGALTHHVMDLDGGGAELWSATNDLGPVIREPTTRFTVRRFDGESLEVLDEFERPGDLWMFADVDGDGYTDAVMHTGSFGAATWLPGDARGQVGQAGLPFTSEGFEYATFGDRNGDGAIDAMVGPARATSILDFHAGDGAGGFDFAGGIDLQVDHPIFKVNPVGERRVLIAAQYMCIGFCSPATQAVIVETDLDGTPSELARISAEATLRYVDSFDRNGDGLPDVLLDRTDHDSMYGRIGWYESPGYAEVVHIEDSRLIDVADVDLDGVSDIVEFHSNDEPLTIRFGVAGEGLGPPHELVGTHPFRGYAQADLDGDGWLDFVAPHADDGMFAIWSIVPCEG